MDPGIDAQLRRQSLWLRESWLWLMRTKVMPGYPAGTKPTALDVGCGPGFVMEHMHDVCHVKGVDIDPEMVSSARARGLAVIQGDAHDLPFHDGEFDIVYCTFVIMWLKDPAKALSEMARVSRRWVLCLAEPDVGARIDHPEELGEVKDLVIKGIRSEGGDPLVGRKLRGLLGSCGLEAEVGVHAGVWSLEKLRQESEDEWRYIETAAGGLGRTEDLARAREAWKKALDDGSLFQFSPVFYALAKKDEGSHR